MTATYPVYQNILNQPEALTQVMQYQLGGGRAQLDRAAELISQSRRVVIGSIGASFAASFPFITRLAELGIKVILEDASELLHYNLKVYDAQTVFILISRSGDTIEISRLIAPLKDLGAKIIGITNVQDSHLGHESDVLIYLDCPADQLIAIQTFSATVLSLYMLAERIARRLDQDQCQMEIETTIDAVTKTRDFYRESSQAWSTHFDQFETIYLLGRGASQATACAGQLLFHEMAWHPATFYNAGHFRHGPWEVIQKGFLGFVFSPEDACYALNTRLAGDITRMRGEVRLVTVKAPVHFPAEKVWRVSRVPTNLSPLVEIIPVQFFVYEFSCWKGNHPGEFRLSTPVTLSEGESSLFSD